MIIHSKLILRLFSVRWKRTLSFIIALALLSTTVGLLGHHFLTQKSSISPVALGYVDQDQSTLSKLALQMALPLVGNSDYIQLSEFQSQDQGTQALEKGDLSALFVLPKDFLESVLTGENKPITMVLNSQKPLHTAVIKFFIQDVLAVLQHSQMGIYAALDYAKEEYPEEYDAVYTQINKRFIATAFAFNTLVEKNEISVTGSVPPVTHYFFTTVFFLLLLSSALYLPFVQNTYTPTHRIQLAQKSHSPRKIVGGIIGGWGIWNLLFSLLVFIGYYFLSKSGELPFSPTLVIPLVLLGFLIAAFGSCLSFLFQSSPTGILALCIYSLLGLFFSGGILPLAYTKSWVEKVAVFFPSYWFSQLTSTATQDELSLFPFLCTCLFILFFSLVALYGYGKVVREVKK